MARTVRISTCRGCGLIVARAISNDHYEAENTGPAYQPPVHAFPDEDTPLGVLCPSAVPLAGPIRGRPRRPRLSTTVGILRGEWLNEPRRGSPRLFARRFMRSPSEMGEPEI
jgi:hypothetical protein